MQESENTLCMEFTRSDERGIPMHYFAIFKNGKLTSLSRCSQISPMAAKYEISEAKYTELKEHLRRTQEAAYLVMTEHAQVDDMADDIREGVRREVIERFAEEVYFGMDIEAVPAMMQTDIRNAVDA